MKALYKRIVTLGMISITAILAWIYCMIEYRSTPVYIIGVSLALVISVYALLLAAMDLHSAKEENLKKYIDETVASALSNEDSTTTKLYKASYVNMRKITAIVSRMEDANAINSDRQEKLLNELSSKANQNITQSINKTLKLALKYNEVNNNKLLSSMRKITAELESLSALTEKCSQEERTAFAEAINALSNDIIQVKNRIISMSGKLSDLSVEAPVEESKDSLDIFEEEVNTSDILAELEGMANDEEDADDTDLEFATDEEIIDADEKNAEDISVEETALNVTEATEAPVVEEASSSEDIASTITNVIPEANVVDDDPNKMLSPDDIAALFASVAPAEETAAEPVSEPAAEPVPEPAAEEEDDAKIADVIPFPSSDSTEETATAEPENKEPEISPEFDPNKQLSPDEIAALFASAMPAEEPAPEPEPEAAPAVSDDPNKQLSPEEIAALFASMQ